MSCPRYSVKFDNLLREFSQLRGFQQTLRTVLEMVSQNRKDFKEVLQAAARPFFVGDWRNTDEKPWLQSAHQMPPPKCPESFRAIALAQAGFFLGGAATWELRKKGPCGKLLRLIGHFYWEMLWNGMNSVSTASWNPTLRQGCHGLNLAVHKSEVRFWNWYHTQGVYVHIEQSSKNTQSEFVGLKQSGFEHLQRFFNQPIDWYNCLIWTWVQLKLGNPKSNMRYITVTSENN